MITSAAGIVGVGYESRTLTEFVDGLLADGVGRLVDVRLTPISRKPGFSKTALSRALSEVGIGYEHRPELGNPKVNRAGFAGDRDQLDQARRIYADMLRLPAAVQTLDSLAARSREELIAVLCFEADQARCHRDVVLAEIAERTITAVGSRSRAR
ncbi:DUF488 domain-containing protein [Phytohabitans sp. ZYX-F-186]|uniref:DUF488 domain-containing protein n=1 Tax=Phytohabitans maris TaxID=3071409 RepID=A0ABU0ZJA8_9ACTN|nr:DUF488 domain-containing protein [Phytohabitans sp. ZYX-F-186]MDQ7907124.1 DUF488 domain-containing protein [Phytohabitans sp. ZYX-F-186]